MDASEIAFYVGHVNEVPNLQLLSHDENNEKRAKPFVDYLARQWPDDEKRSRYLEVNHIPAVDLSTKNFRGLFEARLARERSDDHTGHA